VPFQDFNVVYRRLFLALFLALIFAAAFFIAIQQAVAGQTQSFVYKVVHPDYGTIGTYTNEIARDGETIHVASRLEIAVRFLGMALYTQQANRHEEWRRGRLVSFRGVTIINGKRVDITGDAVGDRFVVTSPRGTVEAPADIKPTNPWSPQFFEAATLMSTSTGRVLDAHVTSRRDTVVGTDGKPVTVRRFDVISDKRETVWVDDSDVTVGFRVIEEGRPVDFILIYQTGPADIQGSVVAELPGAALRGN
jgi:hypothetical protein